MSRPDSTRLPGPTRSAIFRSLFVAAAWLFVGCAASEPRPLATPAARSVPSAAREQGTTPVVVIIAIDGVRWQEVFQGPERVRRAREGARSDDLTPVLRELFDGKGSVLGAPGFGDAPRVAGPRFLSLPGYSEMLSGRAPSDCGDNDSPRALAPTLLDQLAGEPDVRLGDVALFSSWPSIALVAALEPERLLISSGRSQGQHLELLRSHPELRLRFQGGAAARPAPGTGDYRPDRHTAELALAYLELRAPRFLFIGLGETDEYAHQNRYDDYLAALQASDALVGRVLAVLDRFEKLGTPTALFVTTDHGRADTFVSHGTAAESARVWVAAQGSLVRAAGRVRARQSQPLGSLVPTIQALFGLPPTLPGQVRSPFAELLPNGIAPARVVETLNAGIARR